jgi:hypothetical protein
LSPGLLATEVRLVSKQKLLLGIFSYKDFVLYETFCDETAPLTLSTA